MAETGVLVASPAQNLPGTNLRKKQRPPWRQKPLTTHEFSLGFQRLLDIFSQQRIEQLIMNGPAYGEKQELFLNPRLIPLVEMNLATKESKEEETQCDSKPMALDFGTRGTRFPLSCLLVGYMTLSIVTSSLICHFFKALQCEAWMKPTSEGTNNV